MTPIIPDELVPAPLSGPAPCERGAGPFVPSSWVGHPATIGVQAKGLLLHQESNPVLQRHRLRLELRRAREAASLSQREVADALRWTPSKVVRLEAGQVRVSFTDLTAMLELYHVDDPGTVAGYVELAERSRQVPWKEFRDVLPAELGIYLGYEGAAVRMRAFQRDGVHDLLQTRDYARCIIRSLNRDMPAETVERLVEVRMRRQELLCQPHPPDLSIILDEPNLLRPPGQGEHARKVLQAQLKHLHELTSIPNITVWVMPISAGYHPGIEKPFVVLDLPEAAGSIVYRQGIRSEAIICESPEVIAYYERLFERLLVASEPTASRSSGGTRNTM